MSLPFAAPEFMDTGAPRRGCPPSSAPLPRMRFERWLPRRVRSGGSPVSSRTALLFLAGSVLVGVLLGAVIVGFSHLDDWRDRAWNEACGKATGGLVDVCHRAEPDRWPATR